MIAAAPSRPRELRVRPAVGVEKSDGPWTSFESAYRRAVLLFWKDLVSRLTFAKSAAVRDDFREVGRLVVQSLFSNDPVAPVSARIITRAFTDTADRIGLSRAAMNDRWLSLKTSIWRDITAQSTVNGMRDAAALARKWKLSDSQTSNWLRDTAGLTPSQVKRMATARLSGQDTKRFGESLRKQRAALIAEHQSQWSYQQGQRAAYIEVQRRGGTVTRTWVTASNPCDRLCLPMRGRSIGPDATWALPDGREVETPVESHPHCRCKELYKVTGVTKTEPLPEGPVSAFWVDYFITKKFNAGQPRHPAGTPQGGQWLRIAGAKGKTVRAVTLEGLPITISSRRHFNMATREPQLDSQQLAFQIEMGDLMERVTQSFIRKKYGRRVGRLSDPSINTGFNNDATDLVFDHRLLEVKGGNAANVKDAQKWRITVDQTRPARLRNATPEQMARHWDRARQDAVERKYALADRLSKKLGVRFGLESWYGIVNTTTRKVDIYRKEGVFKETRWTDKQLEFMGSVSFTGWTAGVDAQIRGAKKKGKKR